MRPIYRLSPVLIFFGALLIGCAGGSSSVSPSPVNSQRGNPVPVSVALRVITSQMPQGQSNSPYWASLSADGGDSPYHWSIASGQLPTGLALNSEEGTISGTATNAGAFPFTLRVEDSGSKAVSARADLAIDVASPGTLGTAGTGCSGSGCYGPGLGADGLANTRIGPYGVMISYRFRAEKSGVVKQLRIYLITDHTIYSAGTGGKLQIDVVTDDGTAAHNPSSTVLASYLMDSPRTGTPLPDFPVVKFSSPPTLAAGNLYHIVISNPDPDQESNFVSVDSFSLEVPTTPVQPGFTDVDSAVLLHETRGEWRPRAGYTPIMELGYSDGSYTGQGYIEGWVGAQESVSGNNSVRETFTISGAARKVGIAGIRAARVSGNDALKVRLENEDGSLIEQASIDASAFPLSDSPQHRWGSCVFSSSHTLAPGKKYHLVFETAASSTYKFFPIRKGGYTGFSDSTFYHDGWAEMKEGGGDWVGWTQWDTPNRRDGDLQFYFGLVQ